jgi:hypothetical protein
MVKKISAASNPSISIPALYGTVTDCPGSASIVGSLSMMKLTAQMGLA